MSMHKNEDRHPSIYVQKLRKPTKSPTVAGIAVEQQALTVAEHHSIIQSHIVYVFRTETASDTYFYLHSVLYI